MRRRSGSVERRLYPSVSQIPLRGNVPPRCCKVDVGLPVHLTASAYTEMNATTKGVSLGIYDKNKEKGMEPGSGTAQPHVELMGRRM